MFPVAIELRRAYGNANGRFNFFVVVLMPEKLPEALETFRPVAHLHVWFLLLVALVEIYNGK